MSRTDDDDEDEGFDLTEVEVASKRATDSETFRTRMDPAQVRSTLCGLLTNLVAPFISMEMPQRYGIVPPKVLDGATVSTLQPIMAAIEIQILPAEPGGELRWFQFHFRTTGGGMAVFPENLRHIALVHEPAHSHEKPGEYKTWNDVARSVIGWVINRLEERLRETENDLEALHGLREAVN